MDPTLLGTIEDVAGTTIRVQLADSTVSGLSFIEGQSYRVGQVGGSYEYPWGLPISTELSRRSAPARRRSDCLQRTHTAIGG